MKLCEVIGTIAIIILLIPILFPIERIQEEEEKEERPTIEQSIKINGTRITPKCWIPEGRNSCAPHFIFTGPPKSGADAAYSYFLEHPQVLPLANFVIDSKKTRTVLNKRDSRFFSDTTWVKMLDEYDDDEDIRDFYFGLFPEIWSSEEIERENGVENTTTVGKVTGEISEYYFNQLYVPLRVKKFLPDVKLIVFLRNPIDRAYSDYFFRHRIPFIEEKENKILEEKGLTHNQVFMDCYRMDLVILQYCRLIRWYKHPNLWSSKDLVTCYNDKWNEISSTPPLTNHSDCVGGYYHSFFCTPFDYVRHCPRKIALDGIYPLFLRTWMFAIPRRNFLIIETEEFYTSPADVMQKITEFMEIDDGEFDWKEVVDKNITVNPFDVITADKSKQNSFHPNFVSDFNYSLDPVDLTEMKLLTSIQNVVLSEVSGRDQFLSWHRD